MPAPGFALDPFLVPRYRAGGQGPHLRATLVPQCQANKAGFDRAVFICKTGWLRQVLGDADAVALAVANARAELEAVSTNDEQMAAFDEIANAIAREDPLIQQPTAIAPAEAAVVDVDGMIVDFDVATNAPINTCRRDPGCAAGFIGTIILMVIIWIY